jgi:predicted heme/steroid binding protein
MEEMKEFTSEELVSFNGKDGNPVYIAAHGKVYDVSNSRLPKWAFSKRDPLRS